MLMHACARYLGVVVGPETYDGARDAFSSSKVAFEWSVGDEQGSRTEVVIALCQNAVRPGGVPAPNFAGSIPSQISAAELERLAAAAGLDVDASHEHYGKAVECWREISSFFCCGYYAANYRIKELRVLFHCL